MRGRRIHGRRLLHNADKQEICLLNIIMTFLGLSTCTVNILWIIVLGLSNLKVLKETSNWVVNLKYFVHIVGVEMSPMPSGYMNASLPAFLTHSMWVFVCVCLCTCQLYMHVFYHFICMYSEYDRRCYSYYLRQGLFLLQFVISVITQERPDWFAWKNGASLSFNIQDVELGSR